MIHSKSESRLIRCDLVKCLRFGLRSFMSIFCHQRETSVNDWTFCVMAIGTWSTFLRHESNETSLAKVFLLNGLNEYPANGSSQELNEWLVAQKHCNTQSHQNEGWWSFHSYACISSSLEPTNLRLFQILGFVRRKPQSLTAMQKQKSFH